ncbi:MAG: hypothetical protein KIT83_19245, partial [Bryobacterales bacterium]|nr:hypothetical protein [Bryobacterales bacterium]
MPGPSEPDYTTVDYLRTHHVPPGKRPAVERARDGSLRRPDGSLIDPTLAFHQGYDIPPVPHSEPGEPDWNLVIDWRRPVQGSIIDLFAMDVGRRYFLQRFRYTKAGPVPDGKPQPIKCGRTPDNRPIYACPHTVPPPIRERFSPYTLDPFALDGFLYRQNVHPNQYKHLDPALVAQEVDPPWVVQYPDFFRPLPIATQPPAPAPQEPQQGDRIDGPRVKPSATGEKHTSGAATTEQAQPQRGDGIVLPWVKQSETRGKQTGGAATTEQASNNGCDNQPSACKADSSSPGRRPGKKQPPQASTEQAP